MDAVYIEPATRRFQRRRSSVLRMLFFRSIATVARESLVAPMRSIMAEVSVGRKLNKIAMMTFRTKCLQAIF